MYFLLCKTILYTIKRKTSVTITKYNFRYIHFHFEFAKHCFLCSYRFPSPLCNDNLSPIKHFICNLISIKLQIVLNFVLQNKLKRKTIN